MSDILIASLEQQLFQKDQQLIEKNKENDFFKSEN
jgi:hypothetical protein